MSEKILLIVESPNKVKTLKEFLPSNYTVMASCGHIMEIKNGGTYWNTGIDPNNKFKADYVVAQDKKDIVDNLKKQVERADKVIIASDPDREGEAIAWSLKKFLKIPKDKYERVTFHEITKPAVLKALEHPRDIDDDLVSAAEVRRKLDKLVGFRLTPLARGYKSVGRCQGAGLKLIVQREEEINNFVSETYYDLYLYFKKDGVEFKAKFIGDSEKDWKRITSLEDANRIVNECNGPFKILSIETKERLSNPKPPFITATMQQEVASKLKVITDVAQSYAQKLFEGVEINGKHIALITYIRTDSTDYAPEFVPLLEEYVKTNYGEKYYAPLRKYKKDETAQDGHEAIRPVDLSMTPEKLSHYISNEKLLKTYEIIYNRTVATMMKPQVISETTYTIQDISGGYRFAFVSKEEIFNGYKKVYNYVEDKEDTKLVKTTFKQDEKVNATGLDSEEKHTNPPSRYAEAKFPVVLKDEGIGRPSTYTTIGKILRDRGYCIVDDDGYLVPTELGINLSHFLDEHFSDIINVNYTAQMEKDLDLIASSKLNALDFLTSFFEKLEEMSKKVEKPRINKTIEYSDEICPECGARMVVRTSKTGNKFLGCSNYPKCKGIKNIA